MSLQNNFELKLQQQFKNDIRTGLLKKQKKLSSKYFYDKKGSQLFNKITKLPDYYLTACEIEIIEHLKEDIGILLTEHDFNLVELGPGEGSKSEILITHFLDHQYNFSYIPVDISNHYLVELKQKLIKKYPILKCVPLYSDYITGVKQLKLDSTAKNLVLFLGSSIGNFSENQGINFLKKIGTSLKQGDLLLIGFDLKKDLSLLLQAYDNPLTSAFNLNLLTRLNHELGGTFRLNKFLHRASYNPKIHSMESRIISLDEQNIILKQLNMQILFRKNESIHVEYSHKYDLAQIQNFAKASGFKIRHHFFDKQQFFVDSLWERV